jgi:hypothetical protein
MAGPEVQETFVDQTGVVQTPLGPFVRDTFAADCARFLEEQQKRLSAMQNLRPERDA